MGSTRCFSTARVGRRCPIRDYSKKRRVCAPVTAALSGSGAVSLTFVTHCSDRRWEQVRGATRRAPPSGRRSPVGASAASLTRRPHPSLRVDTLQWRGIGQSREVAQSGEEERKAGVLTPSPADVDRLGCRYCTGRAGVHVNNRLSGAELGKFPSERRLRRNGNLPEPKTSHRQLCGVPAG